MTSTHPKSESALLLAMANAQTTDEQRQIAAELETVRRAKRTQDEADRMSSLSLAALAFPDSDTERHTSTASSDWLGDIEVPQVDRTEMENQMRAQATVWLQGRPAEVRADGEEFRTQAASKAHYLSNHFPGHREAAAEAFLDQIRTLAVEDWARADDDAVSASDADQHEKVEFEGATADEEAETSASDSPSLAEGTEPEGDTPMDDSDPAWQGKNHDDSTFNREDAGQTVAHRKQAASTHNLSVGDRVMLTQDGKEREFEVTSVSPSGSTGRAESAGPRVTVTLVGGKGYSVSFDNHSQPGISSWSKVSARKTAATVTDPSSLKAGDVVSFGSGDSAHSGPLVKDEDGNLGVEGPGEGEWTGVVAYRDGKASWNAVSEVRTGSRKTASRKTTRFEFCEAHQGYFSGDSKRRVAETFVEGGPGSGGPCSPDLCKVFPGTDYYNESSLEEVASAPATWAVNSNRTGSRKTAVSLSNVGVESDTVGTGTDPSGKKVRFSITPAEAKQLKDILFSDLAINFSGVDVEESDIIKEGGRRRVAAVQKSKKDLKSGDSYQDEIGTVYRVVSEPVLEDYLGIGEMSWSMSIADGGGNGFWDSWGEDEDPKVDFLGSADATMGMPSFSSRRRRKKVSNRRVAHNGWTNWDTWNAALWINNEEGIYRAALGTESPEALRDLVEDFGLTGDGFDSDKVNWEEVWTDSEFGPNHQGSRRTAADFSWAFDKEGGRAPFGRSPRRHHAVDQADKPCASCGRPVGWLEVFPNFGGEGILCIDCYSGTPEGRRMPTSDELTRMWGGPVRQGSRKHDHEAKPSGETKRSSRRRSATWEGNGKMFSDECMENGVGCDGSTDEGFCDCGCHSTDDDLQTDGDVIEWHADDPNGYTREVGSKISSRKTAREAMVCETCGKEVEHADWDRCPHCGSSAGVEWETVASRRKTAWSWIYSLKQIVESGQDGTVDGLPVGVELATGIVRAIQVEGGRALLDRPFHEVYDMAVKAFAGAVFSSRRESSRRNHPSAGVDFSWAFANSKNSRKVQK